jgi:hypothetical protein
MKTNRLKRIKPGVRLRRNFVPVELRAKTEISEKYLKDLQMQARAHDVDFDFMMARIFETGLLTWSKLNATDVEYILRSVKKAMAHSLLKGDSQQTTLRDVA